MKLAILDRDGTLNAACAEPICTPEAWVPLPGALDAVARLNRAGWHVVLATNQPGLAQGLLDANGLNAVHAKMHRELATVGARIEAVFYCPHRAEDACGCRKPEPGLLRQISERYAAAADEVWVIGSCAAHMQAGSCVSRHLHWVGSGVPPELPVQVRLHANLSELVDSLLRADLPSAL